jgi:glutathione S-transferase
MAQRKKTGSRSPASGRAKTARTTRSTRKKATARGRAKPRAASRKKAKSAPGSSAAGRRATKTARKTPVRGAASPRPASPVAPLELFWAPRSRAERALWLLEEAGLPYTLVHVDIRAGDQKRPDYLAINPSGKVPALRDGAVVVSESAAICAYVGDRYPQSGLAPAVDAPERGSYLRWLFYAAGCVEPAFTDRMMQRESPAFGVAWGSYDSVLAGLRDALREGPYLFGDWFTAADVMLGSMVRWGVANGLLAGVPELERYAARLEERPALQRVSAMEAAT